MNFHQNPNGWLAYSIEPRQLRTALCPGGAALARKRAADAGQANAGWPGRSGVGRGGRMG